MTSSEWVIPFLILVIIVAIVYFSGRTWRQPDGPTTDPASGAEPDERGDDPPTRPLSGTELIEQLERTLGIAILIESTEPVDPGESVTMRARLMSGRYTTEVAVTAESESKAFEELARVAIAWRNSDYQHIQMWPGAG